MAESHCTVWHTGIEEKQYEPSNLPVQYIQGHTMHRYTREHEKQQEQEQVTEQTMQAGEQAWTTRQQVVPSPSLASVGG